MDQIYAFTGLAEADAAKAEEYKEWIESHAAQKPGTHMFWGGVRYLNKVGAYLDVQTDEERDMLNEIIGQFYTWGRPLPLCEMLPENATAKFKLFLDLEISCADQDDVNTANQLVDSSVLLLTIIREIGTFFNSLARVDACLFRSSGVGSDGIAKSTNRIHFPMIVVDKEGLWNVMLMLVNKLELMSWEDSDEFDPALKRIKNDLQRLDACNSFRNVISQNALLSKHGVRMVMCDKLTEKPYNQPVDRPLDPVKLWRQEPDKDPEIFPKDTLEDTNWVQIGTITCQEDKELTMYNPLKVVKTTRMLRSGPGGSTSEQGGAPRTTTAVRKTIKMLANGVTAEQTQREVLTSFAIDGDVLQGPQDNVSVTFSGNKIEINGKAVNVRVVQSLLESIGATVD